MRNTLLLLSGLFVVAVAGCNSNKGGAAADATNNGGAKSDSKSSAADQVKSVDKVVGTGLTAEKGDLVNVTYTGKLTNGKVFDSNDTPPGQEPQKGAFGLVLGAGSVIKGWDEGLVGMKEGGERELTIPPALAYGDHPPGDSIPPNSTLVFEVKMLGVVKQGQENVFDRKDVKVGTGPEVKAGDYVTVTMVASQLNGKKVDAASIADSKPLTFQSQTGIMPGSKGDKVGIKGLCYGVIGMKAGGVRELILPPAISFTRPLPADISETTISKFVVTLKSVKPGTLPAEKKK